MLLQRGYEGNWLGGTFSKAVFLGNGLIAIVAGLLGHALVEIFKLGPVSPFDAAALVLIGGGVYIALTWTENYGDSADKTPFHTSLVNAGKTIWEGDWLNCVHLSCFSKSLHIPPVSQAWLCLWCLMRCALPPCPVGHFIIIIIIDHTFQHSC